MFLTAKEKERVQVSSGNKRRLHRSSTILKFFPPWVAIVSRQAGLAVWPLGIVRAVTLARLVVTVASE